MIITTAVRYFGVVTPKSWLHVLDYFFVELADPETSQFMLCIAGFYFQQVRAPVQVYVGDLAHGDDDVLAEEKERPLFENNAVGPYLDLCTGRIGLKEWFV